MYGPLAGRCLPGTWSVHTWNMVGVYLEFGWRVPRTWLACTWSMVSAYLEHGLCIPGTWSAYLKHGQSSRRIVLHSSHPATLRGRVPEQVRHAVDHQQPQWELPPHHWVPASEARTRSGSRENPLPQAMVEHHTPNECTAALPTGGRLPLQQPLRTLQQLKQVGAGGHVALDVDVVQGGRGLAQLRNVPVGDGRRAAKGRR